MRTKDMITSLQGTLHFIEKRLADIERKVTSKETTAEDDEFRRRCLRLALYTNTPVSFWASLEPEELKQWERISDQFVIARRTNTQKEESQ